LALRFNSQGRGNRRFKAEINRLLLVLAVVQVPSRCGPAKRATVRLHVETA
jgi:hypothetical protein